MDDQGTSEKVSAKRRNVIDGFWTQLKGDNTERWVETSNVTKTEICSNAILNEFYCCNHFISSAADSAYILHLTPVARPVAQS